MDQENKPIKQIGQIASEAFRTQSDSMKFSGLEKRFNKNANSWCERYKALRMLSFALSWVFNLISAMGLSYLIYHAVKAFNVPHGVAVCFAAIALVLFELLKRKTSDLFWDDYVLTKSPNAGLGVVNFVLIFGLSLLGTYNGYDQGTRDFSPEYQAQKSNDEIERIGNEITTLLAQNEQHLSNKNTKGITYYKSTIAAEKNTARIEQLNTQIDSARATLLALNVEHGTEFEKGVTLGVDTIMYIAIGSEIIFELLMWFMSFFDFRRRIELAISLGVSLDQVIDNTPLYSSNSGAKVINSAIPYSSNSNQQYGQNNSGFEERRKVGFNIPDKGFVSTQKRVAQADTQPDTEPTQKAEAHVPRDTQTDTGLTRPQKDPDYIVLMKKRIRERWAKSFEGHPRRPKSKATRENLKQLALEEWEELEQMGYKIEEDTSLNPWGLEIVSPQKQ